jgi:type IV secretory pathway VirB4 component
MGGYRMNIAIFSLLLGALGATGAWAQDRIYRCGNEYTNTVSEAQAKNCKLISGGNVTVVQAQKPTPAAAGGVKLASVPQQRVDSADQRARDSDARLILEAELKKAESRQTELLKEYNNGEPEKMGPETRNNQKYLDRIADLKASIVRNEGDIAGIRRELGRVPSAGTSTVAR